MTSIDEINKLQKENEFLKQRLLWSKNLCFGFFLLNLKLRDKNRRLHSILNKKCKNNEVTK